MKTELSLHQAELTLKDVQQATFLAIERKVEVISVPLSMLGVAKEYLDGTKIRLATIIDAPFGQGCTELRQASMILAIRRGAQVLECVLNMGWVRDEKYAEIRKDVLAAIELCKTNNVEFRLVIEYRLFTEEELETWVEFFSKIGVTCIITSLGGIVDDPSDNVLISKRMEKTSKTCKLLPSSNVWQPKHVEMAEKAKVKTIRFISLPLFKRCGV